MVDIVGGTPEKSQNGMLQGGYNRRICKSELSQRGEFAAGGIVGGDFREVSKSDVAGDSNGRCCKMRPFAGALQREAL